MNRFGTAALALGLVAIPLLASGATPSPHPTAKPKGHGAMMSSKGHATPAPKAMMRSGGPSTMPPKATVHPNMGATMQDRVPHSTSTAPPK